MAKKQDLSKVSIPTGQFKHSMADPQFGRLVPADFPDERDAIHIATAAVFATEDLNPGDHVGFVTKDNDKMGRSEIAPLGIVDPFLPKPVKKGERFWVFLYPGTIQSLRHNWSHPSFDVRQQLIRAIEETPAKKRMKAFATSLSYGGEVEWMPPLHVRKDDYGHPDYWDDKKGGFYKTIREENKVTFEELIDRATAFVNGGEYWSEGGSFEGQDLYDEFWDDFEELTGLKVPEEDRYSFFSCSC